MPRSFAGLRSYIDAVGREKGPNEAKKAGLAYCDAWKREIETVKIDLRLHRGKLAPKEYNQKVRELNRHIKDMNMSIDALNKMLKI
jgi:hypothetical protein